MTEGQRSYRICVFGSSAPSTRSQYVAESLLLGQLIAARGHLCVNGAGKSGCMGGVNEGTITKNGQVRGVIHKRFLVDHGEDSRVKDLIVTDGWDLSERKAKLFENSDCIIVMPGGVGTFDEFWDGVCARSLSMKGLAQMPFCLVNIDGFYNGFIDQMKRAKQDGILYQDLEAYFHVSESAEEALDWCLAQLAEQADDNSSKGPAFTSARISQRVHLDDKLPEESEPSVLLEDKPVEGPESSANVDKKIPEEPESSIHVDEKLPEGSKSSDKAESEPAVCSAAEKKCVGGACSSSWLFGTVCLSAGVVLGFLLARTTSVR
eukprot:gene10001-11061_t